MQPEEGTSFISSTPAFVNDSFAQGSDAQVDLFSFVSSCMTREEFGLCVDRCTFFSKVTMLVGPIFYMKRFKWG